MKLYNLLMKKRNKISQIQIRISPHEKAKIIRYASKANMGISQWLMSKALPEVREIFQGLLHEITGQRNTKYILAEIHDLLKNSTGDEFEIMVSDPPQKSLTAFHLNYIAAMVEYTAGQKGRNAPSWTKEIAPLEKPFFGSELKNLRLHLLTHSPPPFRRRNIFIDSTIGKRI